MWNKTNILFYIIEGERTRWKQEKRITVARTTLLFFRVYFISRVRCADGVNWILKLKLKLVCFSIPSSACGLYLEIAVREWEPNSTPGVCGSRSSPPTLLSAVTRSFHRIFTRCAITHSPSPCYLAKNLKKRIISFESKVVNCNSLLYLCPKLC